MARLPYLDREDLSELDRDIFDDLLKKRGSIGNIFRVAAHSPLLLKRMLHFSDGLRNRTKLDPCLRELAILTVGRLTGCEYEYKHHQAFAKNVGVPPEQIAELDQWETSTAFGEKERAIIQYATEMTERVQIKDQTFENLGAFLDKEQIVELSLNTAFYNMIVRFLTAMEVDFESN